MLFACEEKSKLLKMVRPPGFEPGIAGLEGLSPKPD